MGIDGIIKNIQDLLIFFVPGFLSLRIKTIYGFQGNHENFSMSIYAFLYSFIIKIIYMGLLFLAKLWFNELITFMPKEIKEIIKPLVFLLLGGFFGIVLAKFSRSDVKRWFGKLINVHYSPEKTPWEAAMSVNTETVHARVYLNNGRVYHGTIGEYTMDPDASKNELVLYDYYTYYVRETTLNTIVDNNPNNPLEPQLIIEKMFLREYPNPCPPLKENKEKVYINAKDVLAIEITPIPATTEPDSIRKEKVGFFSCLKKKLSSYKNQNLQSVLCCLSSILICVSSFILFLISTTAKTPSYKIIGTNGGFLLPLIGIFALGFSVYKKYIISILLSFASFIFFLIESNIIAFYRNLEAIAKTDPSEIHLGTGYYVLVIGTIALFICSVWGIYKESIIPKPSDVVSDLSDSGSKQPETEPIRTEVAPEQDVTISK